MDRLIYLLALGVVSFIRLLPITACLLTKGARPPTVDVAWGAKV